MTVIEKRFFSCIRTKKKETGTHTDGQFPLVISVAALCVDVGVSGILLDELAARLNVVTHQHGEDFVGLGGVLDGHLLQQAVFGVHGGFPQLLGVHLAKTFVALGMQGGGVLVACYVLVDECLPLLLGVSVLRELLVRTLVKRRCGDVEVSALNDLRHEAIEECHDKRVDV